MFKDKVKHAAMLMLVCCLGWTMTACGDDDEPDMPAPAFSHVEAVFTAKAEGETVKCFNVTGEWACNGEVMAMAPFKLTADQTYKPGNSKKLPADYAMTFNVTPNPDFVPEEGKEYSAKLVVNYTIQVVATDGSKLLTKQGHTEVMRMEGIDTDKLAEIAARFPKTYKFTVAQTADGKYEIK